MHLAVAEIGCRTCLRKDDRQRRADATAFDRMLTNRTTSEGEAQDAWAKRAVSATVGHRAGTQRVPCADHKGTAAGRAHFVRCCVEARIRRSAAVADWPPVPRPLV